MPAERSQPEMTPEIPDSKTLLIVEDDESNLFLLEEILSDLHLNIVKAFNGSEAVEICKANHHIDLVLMDLRMPVMNGFEATRQIRKLSPDLPIIAHTAYSTDEDKKKALDCGCTDFITKPLLKNLLFSVITKNLGKS